MKRPISVSVALLFAVACSDRSPLAPPGGPQTAISDGTQATGNPDFFFLPPMVPNPGGDPNFDAGAFNPDLRPVVEVCRWTGTACAEVVAQFTTTGGLGSETIRVADEQYAVNWHTDLSNLDPAMTYRILVTVGSELLGFADVDVAASAKELRHLQTGEYIGLVDGRTLPIKFRIEDGALCDPPGSDACASETIVLADGGSVVVPETGDRVDIPAQGEGEEVTITVQYCDGVDTDLPTFGNCIRITADPPLEEALFPPAVVSVCTLGEFPGLSEAQEGLVTLHRQDGDLVTALPHVNDLCAETIGRVPAKGFKGLATAGWNLVRSGLGALMGPRPLHASLVVLDRGGGGETESFSDFQLALPAIMQALPNTDGQTGSPGDSVPYPPGVVVTDLYGLPVAGATIHYEITQGEGTVVPESVVTDSSGTAMVTNWFLGNLGANQLRAWAAGIAGPSDSVPFMPEGWPSDSEVAVPLDTGEVFFNASAVPDTVSISAVNLSSTTLAIGGAGVPYTALVINGTDETLDTVVLQAYISQGAASRAAGGLQVLCGAGVGILPPGACSFGFTLGASNAAAGTGTLVPGLATALFELRDNGAVLDTFSIAVALVNAVRTDGVDLSNTALVIEGNAVPYTAFVTNATFDTLSTVVMQAYIDQGDASRAAGGLQVVCGAGIGNLPPGQCPVSFTLGASNAAAGTGTLVPGPALARFELRDDGTVLDVDTVPVTLLPAVTIDSVDLSSTSLAIEGAGVPYTAFVTNYTPGTLSTVVLQAYIDQGAASRAAGGLQVVCGAGTGSLPPGQCPVSFTLGASNSAAGTGTLVPGSAVARFEVRDDGILLATFTVSVTLTGG